MKLIKLSFLFILASLSGINLSLSQQITQTVRGRIVDKITQSPLPGASIAAINDTAILMGASADGNGYFKMEGVPVGRQTFKVYYVGYTTQTLSNVVINSGRELILNIDLEESVIQMKTFEINGVDKRGSINEMSTGSVRTFNTDETERYAGSRGDPARMASNFAGVQGNNDADNDIIIRGNSPLGLLWRVDGVNIPNPDHFATPGTTGGPVSILNDKVLGTSDFYTGAFPAEYGNSIAGVFDLKMRDGNTDKNEFTGQFGFLGMEILAEGPINKEDHSSYLVSFRYSTLGIFNALHVNIGTNAVPQYTDASFKLNFPTKNSGTFSIFGVGGMDNVNVLPSHDTVPASDLYGDQNRDDYYSSNMGVIGITHLYQINSSSYTRFTLSASINSFSDKQNFVYRDTSFKIDSIVAVSRSNYIEQKSGLSFVYNKKFNSQNSLRIGIYADRISENNIDTEYNQVAFIWENQEQYKGFAYLFQPFIEYQFKASDNFVINAGIHEQYFTQSSSNAIEPRFGMKWNATKKQSFGLAFGMHSQTLPNYIYFQNAPETQILTDNKVGFIRSIHYVASYDVSLNNNSHLKLEAYYQHLYDVPVTMYPSAFSMLNQGSSLNTFYVDSLVNKGTGSNYGLELTYEKFFSGTYFFMFTGSLYNSKYIGSDGIERNTDFNGQFATNLIGGKEIKLGKKKQNVLSIGGKITYSGGRLYTPIDTAQSIAQEKKVEIDSLRNTLRFKNYFRADIKIGFRFNSKKITHEIGLDLINIFNTQNILDIIYAPNPLKPDQNPMVFEYQLGFLPILYYKIDF